MTSMVAIAVAGTWPDRCNGPHNHGPRDGLIRHGSDLRNPARISFSFLGAILVVHAIAQAPAIQWQKCLGGSDIDIAYSSQQTTDGGSVVAGWTESNDGDVSGNLGDWDFWVVKLDGEGNLEWQRALGGTNADVAYAIQQTSDDGYIVAGYTLSNDGDITGNHGGFDCWVVKLDAAGTMLWQKALGGSQADQAQSIKQTTDGGYIVAGWTGSNDGDVSGNHGNNDVWVVKLDPAGAFIWQKALGGSSYEQATSIQQTSTGGYILAGQTDSNDGDVYGNHGSMDLWVVELVATGNLLWQRALGGSLNDGARSIQLTSDGGYIVAGSAFSNDGDVSGNHGNGDQWVVKLDAVGNLVWQKCLGGGSGDVANGISETNDGRYIVAGSSLSNDGDVSGTHGSGDAWVLMLDAAGSLAWQKCLGGSDGDVSSTIQQTSDGGYFVAGSTSSNDGDASGNHGDLDFWVVKLDSTNTGVPDQEEPTFTLSPNPGDGLVLLRTGKWMNEATITLTDALGRELLREPMNGNEFLLDLSPRPAGLYLVTLRSVEGMTTRRLLRSP